MPLTKHPYPASETQVLYSRGSDRDIGLQHAQAFADRIPQSMLHFFVDFWKRVSNQVPEDPTGRALHRIAKWVLNRYLIGGLEAQIPDWMRERLDALAEVTGMPKKDVYLGTILPDLLPILQSLAVRLHPGGVTAVRLPQFGCSSFVMAGQHFLHGRNLDFPGVAYWDRHPVIQVFDRPGLLKYAAFTTAGVPLGGITGINEAQISVSLHQHYCDQFSLSGKLPFAIGETILAKATRLEEAIAILDEAKVAASWAFVLTDGKTRESRIYETHPNARGCRSLEQQQGSNHPPVLTHTNFYQNIACKPSEYAATARMNWDNAARSQRLKALVTKAGHNLNPQQAVQIISDHVDPHFGEEKMINRIVSQVYNIQSLVLDSEKMEVYLAEGGAPIHLRHYRKYDLSEIFQNKDGRTEETHPAYAFKDTKIAQAKELYILSFVDAMDGKLDTALDYLEESVNEHFCPESAQTLAVLHLKNKDWKKAEERLTQAKETLEAKTKEKHRQLPPEYFETLMFLARTADLQGHRTQAIALYNQIAQHPDLEDNNLRRLAHHPPRYTADRLSRILTPYGSYIPFQ